MCMLTDCNNKHYAKGFCEKHYRRWNRGQGHWKSYLDLPTCLYCRNKKYAKGLCKNHYYQWKRAIEGRCNGNTFDPTIGYYGPDLDDYGNLM